VIDGASSVHRNAFDRVFEQASKITDFRVFDGFAKNALL